MSVIARDFWESTYSGFVDISPPEDIGRAVARAQEVFGPLQNKRVLDVGCGNGGTSVLFAEAGARVTAIDYSKASIANLVQYVEARNLTNIEAVVGDAMEIDRLGEFDFVFGSLVLHHLEPFGAFCKILRKTLKTGGTAFFYENNAGSELLVWCRKNLVGKFGIPKFGDADEFPLMPGEINMLREHFTVSVEIPEMIFFRLASIYLLGRRFDKVAKRVDDTLFRYNIGVKNSYRQYVKIMG